MGYLFKLNTALLWAVFLIATTSVQAQVGILDREFKTYLKTNSFLKADVLPRLNNLNDSTLIYSINSGGSDNTIESRRYYWVNKDSLSIRDSIKINLKDSSISYFSIYGSLVSFGVQFISDLKWPSSQILFKSFLETDSILNLSFSSTSQDYLPDSLNRFKLKLKNRFLFDSPFLYDSIIYIFTANLTIDTAYLSSYSLNGGLILEKVITDYLNDSTMLNYPYAWGPKGIAPLNDSLLLFGTNSGIAEIQFINRFTFKKVGQVRLKETQELAIAANEGWLSKAIRGFELDSNQIVFYGNLLKAPVFGSPEYWQFFRLVIDYNGNILDKVHLGNPNINNKGILYNRKLGNEYFVGSIPFQSTIGYDTEYRQLLAYKLNSSMSDSLLLYGQKNHFVSGGMVVDPNGDIFISSLYSNAWTDDSVYTVITKIPNSLLVSVKEYNPKVSSILVYPNPTRDQLRVDGAEIGEFYKVVSITGQLVLEGKLSESKTINVGSLKTGTYFLQLESQRAATYRANVFMKE